MEEFFSSSTIPNFAKQHLAGSMAEDREVPKYAILSHVCESTEIRYCFLPSSWDNISQEIIGQAKMRIYAIWSRD